VIKIRSEADRKYTFFGRFIFAAFFPEPGKKKAAFPVQNAAFSMVLPGCVARQWFP
jgi:hypothetical protein